jgi:hypothetical protein
VKLGLEMEFHIKFGSREGMLEHLFFFVFGGVRGLAQGMKE